MNSPKIPEWNRFSRVDNVQAIVKELDIIPEQWSLTPLEDKTPKRKGWQSEEKLSHKQVADFILFGDRKISQKTGNEYISFCSGFGLRTGDYSDGLIAIDIDGSSAQPLLMAISGGDIPKTTSWTSGKPGRYQLLFQVPPEIRENLKEFNKKALTEWEEIKADKGEQLEVRYNRMQSALPPSRHPTTGQYKWLNSPKDCEVALAPDWLCNLLIQFANKDNDKRRVRKANTHTLNRDVNSSKNFGVITDLFSFLNYEVLPRLTPEQIYSWPGHNFQEYGSTLKGNPPWRESASGTSFHVWWDGEQWAWQDKLLGEGGGAVQYRWKLRGGYGTPKGKDYVCIVEELARDAGLSLPNFNKDKSEENKDKEEIEPERLNKLSIAADEIKIKHDPIQKEWGTDLNCIQIASQIPAQSTLFLKAPTGKGKSETIKEILKLFPKSAVVSLTPTITLNRGLCENYQLNFIDDIEEGFDPSYISTIGLCYPSVWKMKDRLYDQFGHNILILDELRSGLEFLALSNECNKENRRGRNFQAFIQLLENSDLVICADAYLTDIEKNFIKKYRRDKPTLVLNVEPERRARTIFEIKSKKDLLDLIIQSLTIDNEPIAIATDSQSLGEEIDQLLISKGIETFRHDRKTAGEAENIKFIENPTAYIALNQEIKTLIWSPSMGQGSSITACHFAKLFAYNAHLPPANFMQLVGRIRPLIPLYYHVTGDKPKDSGCDSWFVSEQKAAMFDSVERLHELLDAAIATSEDGERQYNLAKQLVQIVEQRENCDNKILDLVAALRARKAYFTTNRRDKIRKQFLADGFEVLDFNVDENLAIEGTFEEIKEVKEELRNREAVGIVKAKELTDIEAEGLQKRRVRSQSQDFELKKYFFNKQFPMFLDSLESEQAKVSFFMNCLKDKYWLKTVINRWAWKNKEKINNKEFLKIEKQLNQFFVDKIDLVQDLIGISQPYRQFCQETGFWERFAPEKILTFSDVLQWVFRVDDVSEILNFASTKDATKEQRKEFNDKYIKPLGSRYKRELATHLKIRLQADPVYLQKRLTRGLGDALARQGYELNLQKKVEGVRIYKITDSDEGIKIDWRRGLESALNKDPQFLTVGEPKPLQDNSFSPDIRNTGV
jgi:hypothetical protein